MCVCMSYLQSNYIISKYMCINIFTWELESNYIISFIHFRLYLGRIYGGIKSANLSLQLSIIIILGEK